MDRSSLFTLLALTLAGGLLGNFGPALLLRTKRGREIAVNLRWWSITVYVVLVLAVAVVVVVWGFRWVTNSQNSENLVGPFWYFLLFGFAVGLPFSLTSLFSVRRSERIARERAKRKKPASRQERVDYAKTLEGQIREFSNDLSDARVVVKGNAGTVIAIHGSVSREQAERLVDVLKDDLVGLGIQRVESGNEDEKWWVRVSN